MYVFGVTVVSSAVIVNVTVFDLPGSTDTTNELVVSFSFPAAIRLTDVTPSLSVAAKVDLLVGFVIMNDTLGTLASRLTEYNGADGLNGWVDVPPI